MSLFRKRSNKDSKADPRELHRDGGDRPRKNANRKRRSWINEKILRDGPDVGFVWDDEVQG